MRNIGVLCVVIGLTWGLSTQSWAGYVIDADLSDWGVTPFVDWVPDGTADYIVTDNVNTYHAAFYNEGYDFEARMYTEEDGILIESRILEASKKRNRNAMEHFADCILDDQEPITTGEQGLECMRIIDAIYLSAEKGREIQISQ